MTKTCPDCGKQAITWSTGLMKTSNPPYKCYEYRCGCGWRGNPFDVLQSTNEQVFSEAWRRANPNV